MNETEELTEVTESVTVDSNGDDWGDFSSVFNQLKTEEQQTESDDEAPSAASEKVTYNNVTEDSMQALGSVVFVILEQVTSLAAGIEFHFDEKGKESVIQAAAPVLNKYNAMSMFGNYIEEATLVIAVLGLLFSARQTIAKQKQEALANGKESEAVAA
ncbi:hypothetical protein BIY20_01125 [Vibrio panuliri]|uniref:Uncharacterized protein n=1 Tax=Vibrio panuliri TaxID=1381081 RepID=A0ABX3FFB1_9VIBR|nr:hypothetical protein BIY20_01125 [Vibrio panuliri]